MAFLSLSLLGSFYVALDGEAVTTFESNKVRALLAYLAMESDCFHHRETLAGLLWPERPERNAHHSLSQALWNLRRAIGDCDAAPSFLLINHHTVQFNQASEHRLDATVLTGLLAAREKCHHRWLGACDLCMGRLQQAVALYRGSFFQGFSLGDSPAFEEWVLFQRERFHCLVVEALGRLADCHEQRGEVEQAVQYARRQVELDPCAERAYRQLMHTLALSGQRGAALAQYETCCRTLAEELGVRPEAETTALYERLRDGTELHAHSPTPPRNLPTSLIPFVGREVELAQIEDLVGDPTCRLLTLIGPGGSGKTRLALEAAAAQMKHFADGAFFVSLAHLDSVDAIVPTVSGVLGLSFHEEGDPQQQLLDYLRSKNLLLIMDSLEHLLDGADWVTDVLKTAPAVKILATSQVRLNVLFEHVFPIAGLDLPALEAQAALTFGSSAEDGRGEPDDVARYSAVQLFLYSAGRVRPGLELTAEDLTHVARICHLVQGIPLGILLAAAWMGMFTPAEIAAQISGDIGQSLDFLEVGWRDVPPRHRSIRAVFDRSWNLLPDCEQEVFQGLSVFRGGFTLQAAQQVAGVSSHQLMALVDRSLLHRASTGRYEVHELLRQYMAEKLDQSPSANEAVHDRHSAYYAAALQQWEVDLKSDRQQTALAEIEADLENVRAAWNWAVERGQMARVEEAMDGLCLFHDLRVRYWEGEAVCQMVTRRLMTSAERLTVSRDESRVFVRALAWQGHFSRQLERIECARQLLRQGLTLLDGSDAAGLEKAFLLLEMGHIAVVSDRVEARRLYEQSLALYQALGDRWWTANALGALGELAHSLGAYSEASQWCEESPALR
jgi:predicted ATPase/DNA-binding SARP family transcriptional activator